MRLVRLSILFLLSVFWSMLGAACWLLPSRRARYRSLARVRTAWAASMLKVLRVRVTPLLVDAPERPALCIANHTGYLDIMVLASVAPVLFISRRDVMWWPVVGQMASIGGTLYVDRSDRFGVGRLVERVRRRLRSGASVAFFPEAKSSDGTGLLPFKSSLFAAAEPGSEGKLVPIRPFVLKYRTVGGEPITDANRARVFWYADAGFVSHFWRLLTAPGIEVTVAELPTRVLTGNRRTFAPALREEMLGELLAP